MDRQKTDSFNVACAGLVLVGLIAICIAVMSDPSPEHKCDPCEPIIVTYVNPLYENDKWFLRYKAEHVPFKVWYNSIRNENEHSNGGRDSSASNR